MNNPAGMRLAAKASRPAAAIGMRAHLGGRNVGVGGTGLFADLGAGLDTPNVRANAEAYVRAGVDVHGRAHGGADANGSATRDDCRVATLCPAAPGAASGVRRVAFFIHQ